MAVCVRVCVCVCMCVCVCVYIYVRCILGISRAIQWKEHLTTVELADRFGMAESIDDLLTQYRLRWLGHVARMPDTRHPKKLLFGWLPQKRPAHGARLRWRDKVRRDLRLCNISESSWYMEAQNRTRWRVMCRDGDGDSKGLF